jgi:hypothetical protein
VADCRYDLVAEFETGLLTTPIKERWVRRSGLDYVREFLRLESAVPIDTQTGHEVVVGVDRSASREWVAVFTVRDGQLQRFRVERSGHSSRKQSFSYGGSLISLNAVDCLDQGVVVASFAGRRRTGWNVTRAFLRAEGAALVETQVEKSFRPTLSGFPEFASVPGKIGGLGAFARCGTFQR